MNIALILSGGIGSRVDSEIPKQYIEISGKPIILFGLEQISRNSNIDAFQIVADKAWREQIEKYMITSDIMYKFRGFSEPGKNRQFSIIHGLEDIRDFAHDCDYIFIHDAARPMLTSNLIQKCFQEVRGHDGVLPVLSMKDTVYSSIDGIKISKLLERKNIFAGQTPEVFVFGKYYKANKRLAPKEILQINGSTEPAVMAGMDIVMITGEESNFKITTNKDLERFREIVEKLN